MEAYDNAGRDDGKRRAKIRKCLSSGLRSAAPILRSTCMSDVTLDWPLSRQKLISDDVYRFFAKHNVTLPIFAYRPRASLLHAPGPSRNRLTSWGHNARGGSTATFPAASEDNRIRQGQGRDQGPSYYYDVHVYEHHDALTAACKASSPPSRGGRNALVLWTDASLTYFRRSSQLAAAAAAVVFRPWHPSTTSPEWTQHAFGIAGHDNSVRACELVAIEQALAVAAREWDALRYDQAACGERQDDADASPFDAVRIFSDCEAALVYLVYGCGGDGSSLAARLRQGIDALVDALGARGVEVEMNWTPAHAGVAGNTQADMVARATRVRLPGPARAASGDGRLRVWEVDVELRDDDLAAQRAVERGLRGVRSFLT
ncbi:hypothetical protein D7B24_002646 [Verticillium nonalfalfae]|uniref:Uncharacterized protein n=1 Tax=Verticillium nonalfalfae TaxID=1051616 RepID=A0A3M9XXD7_9PEZI|nr:uncharacterized protein D7B24_002646 [Verticillium nonalfalfae]RNJ52913.1 hypothetical protein D7B24_002646 [Verticillium nonalfalfae]